MGIFGYRATDSHSHMDIAKDYIDYIKDIKIFKGALKKSLLVI